MTLSSNTSVTIENVAKAMDTHLPDKKVGGRWYQMYVLKNRAITESIVKRAEAAGYSALVFTVDCVVCGKRESTARIKFTYPDGVTPENFVELFETERKHSKFNDINDFLSSLYDHSLTWKEIDWLKSITKLPILLKGILSPHDARLAVKCGVAGIIVSNHGGRQLDTSPATITALPYIAQAIKGTGVELILDGGIRRGTDIMKAIALGASCVMVGRPILWGLATSGEKGATHVLNILTNELKNAMQIAGCPSLKDITPDLLLNYPRSNL